MRRFAFTLLFASTLVAGGASAAAPPPVSHAPAMKVPAATAHPTTLKTPATKAPTTPTPSKAPARVWKPVPTLGGHSVDYIDERLETQAGYIGESRREVRGAEKAYSDANARISTARARVESLQDQIKVAQSKRPSLVRNVIRAGELGDYYRQGLRALRAELAEAEKDVVTKEAEAKPFQTKLENAKRVLWSREGGQEGLFASREMAVERDKRGGAPAIATPPSAKPAVPLVPHLLKEQQQKAEVARAKETLADARTRVKTAEAEIAQAKAVKMPLLHRAGNAMSFGAMEKRRLGDLEKELATAQAEVVVAEDALTPIEDRLSETSATIESILAQREAAKPSH